jgi:NAD-dependent dihydropyrimidine dehydrogenase PreA subunit
MIREIITIDENKCDGCGLCVPACEEGAIRIVDGKARLVADRMCDGMGACLGHCPQGALKVERRDADAFDEELVARLQQAARPAAPAAANSNHASDPQQAAAPKAAPAVEPLACGCPGSAMKQFRPLAASNPAVREACPSSGPSSSSALSSDSRTNGASPAACSASGSTETASPTTPLASELTHWPVQINLLPPHAPVLKQASLLVAADCVPVAYAGFHQELLKDRAVVIGCPKFDDLPGYVARLSAIIAANELQEIVVVRMEVPCCLGIVQAVLEARQGAGVPVPVTEVVISTRGEHIASRQHPFRAEG